jgi:hypothetical protein
VYEEKYAGWRMLAVKEAGGVRLISRNGRDHTKRFRAIAEALAALKPKTFTLDGEVTVFDAELISRFEWLRHINHGDLATPPLFMVFDLLQLQDKDYRREPLKVRRKAVEKLVKGQKLILPARRFSPEVARLLKLIQVDQTYNVKQASITDYRSGEKRVFNVGRDHGKTRIILATRTTEIVSGTEEGQLLSAVHITRAARRVIPKTEADPKFQLQKAYWVEQLGRESGCR